jgi:predicted membrane protein
MSIGMAAFLLVLVVLVALAAASFLRHTLAAVAVLVAVPAGLVLNALVGATYAFFAIALAVVFVAVIHTIGDTLRLLRNAKRPERELAPARAERRTSTRRSGRSRIAA